MGEVILRIMIAQEMEVAEKEKKKGRKVWPMPKVLQPFSKSKGARKKQGQVFIL